MPGVACVCSEGAFAFIWPERPKSWEERAPPLLSHFQTCSFATFVIATGLSFLHLILLSPPSFLLALQIPVLILSFGFTALVHFTVTSLYADTG